MSDLPFMGGPGIGLEIVLQEICHRRYRIY